MRTFLRYRRERRENGKDKVAREGKRDMREERRRKRIMTLDLKG